MALKQVASGKSFEFALASAFASKLDCKVAGSAATIGMKYYLSLTDEQKWERDMAADSATDFIIRSDPSLNSDSVAVVRMQSDQAGVPGDVRDVVLVGNGGSETGVSAKVRNSAIRNSRLSPRIDFAASWFDSTCSDEYRRDAQPIWDLLAPMESERLKWRAVDDKKVTVYLPLLMAFIAEIQRQFAFDAQTRSQAIMRYLLGKHDYYKVFKHNSTLSIESFNMDNSLGWGRTFPMPTRLISVGMKPGSETTALMVMDKGWQLSFRLHSAETNVKRSLKFDIQIIGQPPNLTRHELHYR